MGRNRPLADASDDALSDLIERRAREVRGQKQNAEKIAAGEWRDEPIADVQREAVFRILRKVETPAHRVEDSATHIEDDAYRAAQEARYRDQYGWTSTNANDEAVLSQLLDMEQELRRVNRELRRPSIPFRERSQYWDALRSIAASHNSLQKSLGIDKAGRDAQSRDRDPIELLKEQIEAGAAKMRELVAQAQEFADDASTLAEARALMKHSAGLPLDWIDPWLGAIARILGVEDRLAEEYAKL